MIAIIIRRIIGGEVVRAVIGDRAIERRTDEVEDAFIERSKVEALASTDRRPCSLILLPEEVSA